MGTNYYCMSPIINGRIKRSPIEDLCSPEALIKYLIFFLWPLVGFLFSLRTPSSKSSYIIYFCFGAVFSYSIAYQGGIYIDLIHVAARFQTFPSMSFDKMLSSVGDFFQGTNEKKELYDTLIYWIAKQFSNNYHVMFAIASVPFSFFMLKSLATITNQRKFHFCFFGVLVMLLFILPKDIFNVQNFRYSTATWMAIYAIIEFFKKNNYWYGILILVTPLVHSSFYYLVIIFITYLIFVKIGVKSKTFKLLLIISIPFAFIETSIVGALNLSLFSDNINEWAQYYMSNSSMTEFGMSSYRISGLKYLFHLLQLGIYTWGIFIIWRSKTLEKSSDWLKKTFWFYVLFVAITYFVMAVPVLGSRFWGVSRILFIFLWFTIMYPRNNKYLLILLFSCAYEIFYEGVSHYERVLAPDFYFSSLPTLLSAS